MIFFIERKTGDCAFLKDKNRYIFYLVTKSKYYFKPLYKNLESSLKELHERCQELNINHIAMPKIGAGLDKLDWNIVSRIIDDIFETSDIKITIYKI